MQAGKLRHRIFIELTAETRTESGAVQRDWSTLLQRWASVESTSGREQYFARQVYPTATHVVTMRYSDEVTTDMRVKLGERFLYIDSVTDVDQRHIETRLICTEKM